MVDGNPILTAIEKTDLMAVINTPFPMVFRKTDKTYYLIGKETWYRSRNVSGQWQETNNPPADVAALEREASDDEDAEVSVTSGMLVFGATEPTELLSIRGDPQFVPFPGNNLMVVKNTDNNTYVYIYDSTPDVVYVGYTPGYTGCYIHHGVIVYGTGYHYRPWYRHYYYPRPFTYGFSVRYSRYHGWSFGYSFYHGPFSFHFGYAWGPPRYGGWWGPPRYRPPYYRPPHHRPTV